jgi:DNA-binding LacI/PurR family transcriptional regulator
LPEWDETPVGLRQLLGSLFEHTPPTVLILDEAPFFTAAQQFLAGRGMRVPGDVSLVCADPDPSFAWCVPPISHIAWDSGKMVSRIMKWARNVSQGKRDLRQTLTSAGFVEGGTIGPVAR